MTENLGTIRTRFERRTHGRKWYQEQNWNSPKGRYNTSPFVRLLQGISINHLVYIITVYCLLPSDVS